ncbi:MAG: mechanosensitive ion channel family protein [Myxococcota bacterium]
MLEWLRETFENRYARGAAIALASIVGAYLVAFIIERGVKRAVGKTKTELDDKLIAALHRPVVVSVMLTGFGFAAGVTPMHERAHSITVSALKTVAIIVWAIGALRIVRILLEALSTRGRSLVQPRTLPFFDMVGKVLATTMGVYFVFLAWKIDLTAWLASAGIIGIAVGFAAQDTLANLFSGLFIVADAPYKIGDYIVLEDGLRGRVASIGIRSTRVLTRDNIEITIPNAVIASSKIVNEVGGPRVQHRIWVTVDAAYGADLDRVHDVLVTAAKDIEGVLPSPAPHVRFLEFGASGLTHRLYVWVERAHEVELIKHRLNTSIYKAFTDADLEIPYSKHDVYIKEQPRIFAN